MTMTVHVSPELSDASCSVAECLESAAVMASATVSVDPRVSAPPDYTVVTFGLPLCHDHAHLLRQGCALLTFHCGI